MTDTKNTVSDADWLEEAARYFENRDTGGEDMAFWANVSNAERCRSIAQSLRASIPGDVGVRGLEWTRRQRRLDEWKAHTSVGMYEVGEVHGRWSAVLRYVDSDCQAEDVVVGRFDSPDEAKAAAQADYERRVLSALDLSPAEGKSDRDMRDGMDCNYPDCGCCFDSKCSDAPDAAPSNPVISDEIVEALYSSIEAHIRTVPLSYGIEPQLTNRLRSVIRIGLHAGIALSVNPQSGSDKP